MSAQHTPGQLWVSGLMVGTVPMMHIKVARADGADYEQAAANARRLAACWNACEGLTTEALERLGTLDRARVELDVIRVLAIAQRDELLAALQAMLENGGDYTAKRDVARAAIAKVTGSA